MAKQDEVYKFISNLNDCCMKEWPVLFTQVLCLPQQVYYTHSIADSNNSLQHYFIQNNKGVYYKSYTDVT